MASLNKVLLIGNLTRDPEVRMMSSGRPVCNFGIALNRSYKDSEGNKREEVTFVDVECFGPRAEAVGRFFSKGRPIFIEGRLKLDQWESKEGEKRSAIRVVLDNFEFVDSGKSDGSSSPNDSISQPTRAPDALESSVSPPKEDSPPTDPDLDEDVPF
ncbi:single-stranded DNA-binding protein [Opitutales bacterium]|jgi:single-strand DNA-binding protein|nr:single-stranded DNA-binding protein [Opitutales bacterium]MDG1172788.1 single-stranded DNA-binding protein [Opitutales bacterium]